MIENKKFKDIKIETGKLTENEFKELSHLFKRVFKKKFSTEFLKWYYLLNPNGPALTNNAYYNGKIIGHYALIPIRIKLYEEEFKAALSVFTAIDENFRGLYLFNELANKTFELAKDEGKEFIIGVSNQKSTKLFVRYFKFKLVSQLDVKFGIGKIKKLQSKNNFKVIWNDKSLSWRLKNPRFDYQSNLQNKEFFVYNNFYKFFKIEIGRFSQNQFSSTFKNFRKKYNFRFFNLWIGLGNYRWKNSLYFNFPEKLKPAPLNFIIKDISNKNHNIAITKESIDFQLIDFDIF